MLVTSVMVLVSPIAAYVDDEDAATTGAAEASLASELLPFTATAAFLSLPSLGITLPFTVRSVGPVSGGVDTRVAEALYPETCDDGCGGLAISLLPAAESATIG
jgi:hypothetical protein